MSNIYTECLSSIASFDPTIADANDDPLEFIKNILHAQNQDAVLVTPTRPDEDVVLQVVDSPTENVASACHSDSWSQDASVIDTIPPRRRIILPVTPRKSHPPNVLAVVLSPAECEASSCQVDSPRSPDVFDEDYGASDIGTPLTPPSSGNAREDCQDSPSTLTQRSKIGPNSLCEEDGGKDFIPGKILRNHTAKLQSIIDSESFKIPGQCISRAIDIGFSSTPTNSNIAIPIRKASTGRARTTTTNPPIAIPIQKTNTARKKTTSTNVPLKEILEFIIPTGISHALGDGSRFCIAIAKRSMKRCKRKVKKPVDATRAALLSLSKLAQSADYINILAQVEAIVHSAACNQHINSTVFKEKFGILGTMVGTFPATRELDESLADHAVFWSWIDSVVGSTQQPAEKTAESPQGDNQVAIDTKSNPPPLSNTASQSTPVPAKSLAPPAIPLFKLWQPKCMEHSDVRTALCKAALEDFDGKSDLTKKGFIYLLWLKPVFGKVKIGHSNNPDMRIQQWNSACKRNYSTHVFPEVLAEVAHPARVEKLIHTELKDFRFRFDCESCPAGAKSPRNHREWFEIPGAHVVMVFEKWKAWMDTSPYEYVAGAGKWMLKPESISTLAVVCTPVEFQRVLSPQKELSRRRKSRGSTTGVVS